MMHKLLFFFFNFIFLLPSPNSLEPVPKKNYEPPRHDIFGVYRNSPVDYINKKLPY